MNGLLGGNGSAQRQGRDWAIQNLTLDILEFANAWHKEFDGIERSLQYIQIKNR